MNRFVMKKKLENIEKEMSEIDAELMNSENIIAKLLEVENKFEKISDIEKHLCEKDSAIEILQIKSLKLKASLVRKMGS